MAEKDYEYAQVRPSKRLSWHVVLTPTRMINGYRAYCDRNLVGPTVDTLPARGKSCEDCARALMRLNDQEATNDEIVDG